jgi:hypothetical protein
LGTTYSPLLSAARITKCRALLVLLLLLLWVVLGTAAAAVCLTLSANNGDLTPLASIVVLSEVLSAAWHSTSVLSEVLVCFAANHRAARDRLDRFDRVVLANCDMHSVLDLHTFARSTRQKRDRGSTTPPLGLYAAISFCCQYLNINGGGDYCPGTTSDRICKHCLLGQAGTASLASLHSKSTVVALALCGGAHEEVTSRLL